MREDSGCLVNIRINKVHGGTTGKRRCLLPGHRRNEELCKTSTKGLSTVLFVSRGVCLFVFCNESGLVLLVEESTTAVGLLSLDGRAS